MEKITEITVNKQELMKVIRDNRDRHKSVFEQAIEGYRQRAIEELDRRIADLKAGRTAINLVIALPRPENHTRDYDRVLRMLEMHQGELVEIDEPSFAMYVMDDWAWKRTFLAAAANYMAISPDDIPDER